MTWAENVAPEQESDWIVREAARQKITINRAVHYVARGSADGVFPPVCRAAVITDVNDAEAGDVSLFVMNPSGTFHNLSNEHGNGPGQWHFPGECEHVE